MLHFQSVLFDNVPLFKFCFSQLGSKETEIILSRLTAVEAQLRHQTQLLQALVSATQKPVCAAGALPEGISLPLSSLTDLFQVEDKLLDKETFKALVRVDRYCKC